MITHAVADYFHFESKFFGTIKPLLLKPGILTKEYVAGKRVSFIHPIRLYIFISIVFFVVTLSSNKHEKAEETEPKETAAQHDKTDTLSKEDIKEIKDVMAKVPMTGKMRDSIVNTAVAKAKADHKSKAGKKNNDFNSNWITVSDSTVTAYEARQKLLPKKQRDNFLEHYIVRRTIELKQYPDAGKRMKEEIMHNIPKMMFILLPLFAVILKLVYINKKKYYYEHLIYSFHVHSALFLSYLILFILKKAVGLAVDLDGWLIFLYLLYILWYIYKSLQVFYGSRRWVTVAKILFLMFCYSIVFAISTLTVIAVTVILL